MQYVPNAEPKQEFLLNPLRAKKSIAKNAIKKDKVKQMFKSKPLFKAAFLIQNQYKKVF